MSNVPSKNQPTNPIPRFRRSPLATAVGEMAKKIWRRPRFKVEQTPSKTEFIFSLGFNITKKINNCAPAYFPLLFGPKRTAFKRALKRAYGVATHGSKKVRELCDEALFKVFAESLALLYEEAKDAAGPDNSFKGDATVVREAAKRKRRPPDLERKLCAMTLAKLYDELLPKVKELRKFVCASPDRSDDTKLRQTVEEKFSEEWIQRVTRENALQNLPVVPGHSNKAKSLGALTWTPRQLAVGIIWCIERRDNPAFSVAPDTILNDYLPLGRKLNTESK